LLPIRLTVVATGQSGNSAFVFIINTSFFKTSYLNVTYKMYCFGYCKSIGYKKVTI